MAEFTLFDLEPEPLTFRARNGQVYELLRPSHFGLRSLAQLDRLQQRIAAKQAMLTDVSVESTPRALKLAEIELTKLLDDLIGVVGPDMPDDVCESMTLVEKLRFAGWWTQENSPKSKAPEEAAGTALVTKPIRKKSSRG